MSKKKRARAQRKYSDPDYDAYVKELKKDRKKRDRADIYQTQDEPPPVADSSVSNDVTDVQKKLRRRASQRLASLDALRGLNMLCIVGLATLVTLVCNLHISDFRVFGEDAVQAATSFRQHWPGPAPETIAKHMRHVEWNGALHHDTIFPLFLFLAGVSFPFSLRKQRANGRSMFRILCKAFRRGFALVFLGIIYSNTVKFDFAHLRYMGVLQHIGLAWFFAALIYLMLHRHVKSLLTICALMLVSYWLVVALVPAPDVAPEEAFTKEAFASRAKELFKVQQPYGLVDAEEPDVAPAEETNSVAPADENSTLADSEEPVVDAADDSEESAVAHKGVKIVPIFENNALPDFDAPDYPEIGSVAHNMLPEGCIVNYLDRILVPGKLYHQPMNVERELSTGKLYLAEGEGDERTVEEITEYDPALYRQMRDPEGLASTWPAIVTALLGMLFGGVLTRENEVYSKWRKFLIMTVGGLLLLAIGFAWHLVFPINKNLWNSSFVCFVGGYSALALAIFYLVIDIFPFKWLAFPFVVVGMNSITIYLAARIVNFNHMRDFFFADAIQRFVPTTCTIIDEAGAEAVFETSAFTSIATVAAGLLVAWGFLYWLYRRKIFLKV